MKLPHNAKFCEQLDFSHKFESDQIKKFQRYMQLFSRLVKRHTKTVSLCDHAHVIQTVDIVFHVAVTAVLHLNVMRVATVTSSPVRHAQTH